MKVEPSASINWQDQQAALSPVSADDVNKMARLMSDRTSDKRVSSREKTPDSNVSSEISTPSVKDDSFDRFLNDLMAKIPKDRQELKALLSEHFSLGKHKEQALIHSLKALKEKGDSGQAPLMDLVQKEWGFLIQTNAMIKNLVTYSHKLDLK